MKLSQLLTQGRVTVSCELFPPKTGAALAKVEDVLRDTAALSPDFISVTYGAGGSTSKRTLELAARLQDVYRVPALAHLTCVSATREEVTDMVARLRSAGIENILALRGDIPQDTSFPSPEHYHYANELVAHIRSLPGGQDLCIGAACYPEGHVECPHFTADLDNLKRKVDAGVDFLTTQMFFDNDVLYRFLFRALSRGITVPIVAGIMPVIKKVAKKNKLQIIDLHSLLDPKSDSMQRDGIHPTAKGAAAIAKAVAEAVVAGGR